MYSVGMLALGSLICAYAVFTGFLIYFWTRLKSSPHRTSPFRTRLSVIIPVRNEADTIGQLIEDLNDQRYTSSLFEVLVVNDSSTDDTAQIVKSYVHKSTFHLKLIDLPAEANPVSPKKRAIDTALREATGELIVTTDGDCRVGPDWLSSIVETYQTQGAKIISGPVTFTREQTLFDHLQTVEFSSLIGSGASSLAAGKATMCNGANLAYEKKVFDEVGGFTGNEMLASGDDEFLFHKIAQRYPDGTYFLKDRRAIVQTTPHRRWEDFFRQRKRWASKWKHYKNPVSIAIAVFVFAANAALILLLLLALGGYISWPLAGLLFLIKWVPEWFFIGKVLRFLKKKSAIWYIPLVQLVYPFYVTLFGLVAQKPTYVWKGRELR
jgi:cellulose synthase/poly-beta-1,6-N-acetylglucosamine synthase-like glycosyltransferase